MPAECEIYPGEEVRIVDRQIYGEDDLGSLFSGGGGGGGPVGKRERERGFTGTALAGGGPGAKPDAAAAADGAAAAAPNPDQTADGSSIGGAGGGSAAAAGEALERLTAEALPAVVNVDEAGLDGMSAEDKAAVMEAMLS